MERLDYLDDHDRPDFLLVPPPSLLRHREVEALKGILEERYAALDLNQRTPALLAQHLALEYRKLGSILFPSVAVERLLPGSRYRFFHAGVDGSLSGLQRLLGYTLQASDEPSSEEPIIISSGDPVLDCIVDLGLAPYGTLTPWIADTFGIRDVLLLLTQTGHRQMGQEAVNKIQSERDKATWETIKGSVKQEMAEQGIDIATMMGL